MSDEGADRVRLNQLAFRVERLLEAYDAMYESENARDRKLFDARRERMERLLDRIFPARVDERAGK